MSNIVEQNVITKFLIHARQFNATLSRMSKRKKQEGDARTQGYYNNYTRMSQGEVNLHRKVVNIYYV
jgi:hypothetical protein